MNRPPALLRAPNDEAPGRAGTEGFKGADDKRTENPNRTDDRAAAKALETLRAEAAMRGYEVTDAGVCVWGIRDHDRGELVGYCVGAGALIAALRGLLYAGGGR